MLKHILIESRAKATKKKRRSEEETKDGNKKTRTELVDDETHLESRSSFGFVFFPRNANTAQIAVEWSATVWWMFMLLRLFLLSLSL